MKKNDLLLYPYVELDVLILDCFNIEANSRNSCD